MMQRILPLIIGFCIDMLIGDPHEIPHPVVWIGKLITGLEKVMRKVLPKTPVGERIGGICLWFIVTAVSTTLPAILLSLCEFLNPWLRITVESMMVWQILAIKSLRDESMKV